MSCSVLIPQVSIRIVVWREVPLYFVVDECTASIIGVTQQVSVFLGAEVG